MHTARNDLVRSSQPQKVLASCYEERVMGSVDRAGTKNVPQKIWISILEKKQHGFVGKSNTDGEIGTTRIGIIPVVFLFKSE